MKSKVKLFIFGVETFIVFFIASVMIFTRIYNGSYFSVFHQFDKQEHLILKKKISDHDFNSVNTVSIGIIFVIMMFVLKSISLPVLLVIAIEFAIFINMGIPYYTNTTIPFIASIVIGTIQLGATIDYAILITTKYIQNRKDGKDKKQAVSEALGTSINSIIVSGLCFFGATFGVGAYSKIEMIGSLCTLMSRGAIISVIVVITVLPAFLMIFDKLVCKTTIGMREVKN